MEQEIEIVGEKDKAKVFLCKRVFNCVKTPTTTKNKRCGLELKKITKPTGSFVSGNQFKKQLRLRI